MWYSAIGLVLTILVGIFCSWLTGFTDPNQVHTDLISPPLRRFYYTLSQDPAEKIHFLIEVSFHPYVEELPSCEAGKTFRLFVFISKRKEEIQINQISQLNKMEKTDFEKVSKKTNE